MIRKLPDIVQDIKNKKYWYFSNHNKDFAKMCYVVDLLEKMPPDTTQTQLDVIRNDFNRRHSDIQIEAAMFKSMIVSKLYGLLDTSHRSYVKCNPTPVFKTIKDRTSGNYKNTDLYMDIIEQQIEKIFCITPLFGTKGKEDLQLYPLFLLYKILIEIGISKYWLDPLSRKRNRLYRR
ncbi:MAG: 5-methylcytosine-specific restriction enzyme [Halanaerobiales bacterium]|nr:5-methylcytosine-specific restriction enzyme [Halanaerobiales bacterium]